MAYAKAHPEVKKRLDHQNYVRHMDKIKANVKRYKTKYRQEVLSHYSNGTMKCACCGEGNWGFLTIDHINGGGIKDQKIYGRGLMFFKHLVESGYPEGFQVLCMNCNWGRRTTGICPHKDSRYLL